jgi:hypothetical protein
MPDEAQHDEPVLPEDAVEDLAPEGEDQESVSGGALNAYLKIDTPTDVG